MHRTGRIYRKRTRWVPYSGQYFAPSCDQKTCQSYPVAFTMHERIKLCYASVALLPSDLRLVVQPYCTIATWIVFATPISYVPNNPRARATDHCQAIATFQFRPPEIGEQVHSDFSRLLNEVKRSRYVYQIYNIRRDPARSNVGGQRNAA